VDGQSSLWTGGSLSQQAMDEWKFEKFISHFKYTETVYTWTQVSLDILG